MTPEPEKPASAAEVAEGTEASVAAAAVTLEALQDAIYEEGELSKDRQQELLREVQECRKRLETLSDSAALGAKVENPSIQQLLMEVGRIQTEVQSIRTDLNVLVQEEANGEMESVAGVRLEENSAPSNSRNSGREENVITPSGQQSETDTSKQPPESSPSVIPPPKKRRYVKI